MNKLYWMLSFLLLAMGVYAQDISKQEAVQLVVKNAALLKLDAAQISNSNISGAYHNKTSATDLVYLQQTHKGLPVLNKIKTLAFKNGQLVHQAGSWMQSMEKRTAGASITPGISASDAVRISLQNKKLATPLMWQTLSSSANKVVFQKAAGITAENITVDLMWVPIQNEAQARLAWQVYLVPATNSDYWLLRIDALTGELLDETNLTVYCNFDHPQKQAHSHQCIESGLQQSLNNTPSPEIVNGASYRVIPFPAESPNHAGGTPALKTDPWTLAPGNATSLKWHSDGTNDWTYSRGNNVWAYHDRSNANAGAVDRSAQSTTTPDPLTFDFAPDFSVAPTQTTPVPNQQFNITNLFYWNNIIHDVLYQYGFDEPSGNFQVNNQGRGGLGNDYVRAEAQDGSGTNNANFSTPADGSLPRMQMYLWSGSPQKDGDVDNGIITHEFSHGISNRLAGGPSQAGCVSNAEQMGEGWSDYYALMLTQDWANSALADGFDNPRGIGTYALGQPITGAGIRTQKYCTNFTINNRSYAASISSQSHTRGEIWCATLWDMTWNIINQVGSINPNLFNASGTGGNSIALKLVTEGLKLQPCNSGFLDGRDGILAADQLLYNGAYHCAIMQAFARRGMGYDAVQGSANSVTDQVPGFSTVQSTLTLTQSVTQQLEGLNVTYHNKVKAGPCAAVTNYLLTDTLPSNVTYVSGGTYTSATRVVSFPVNLTAGQEQTYSFTVQINNGSYFPPSNLMDEQVTGSSLPASWTATAGQGSSNFVVSNAQSHSAPNAFFGVNPSAATDYRLATVNPIAMGAAPPILSFWHNYNTEDGWDGGMVEISTNAGASWADLGSQMTENGYNGNLGTGSNNPLGGRNAYTGNSNGWVKTTVSLLPYANQNALFRFRFGSDDNTTVTGWYIDDILLQSRALVNMRSNLFNASGTRVQVKDTITIILENATCVPVSITTQPANANACAGSNTSFTVVPAGTTPNYQWQLSTDGGTTWNNIPGANAATLNIASVTAAMNNYQYKVIVTNACPSTITSALATLTVTNAAGISTHPANSNVCVNSAANFSVVASGSNLTYQWQLSTNGGANWSDITGATAATYTIASASTAMHNNQYRVLVFSCGPVASISNAAILTITQPANITTQPADQTVCPNDNAVFSVSVNGSSLTYQWQLSTNGGTSWNNISGASTATLAVNAITLGMNNYQYRVLVNGTCTVDLVSAAATLHVNQPVSIQSDPVNTEKCSGENASFSVSASGTSLSYQWQVSVNAGPFVNLSNTAPYSGVNTATLTISNVNTTFNNYAYRAILDGPPCGAVTSASATLTVYARPAAVLVAAEFPNITPGTPSGLYVTASPPAIYSYQWYRNNGLLTGVNSSSYPLNPDRLGTYFVNVINEYGCAAPTNSVTIGDSASTQLFIYPSPNNGHFQVRYHNPQGNDVQRTLMVFDDKGALVFKQAYRPSGPYGRMDVNIPQVAAGVYVVSLVDANNKIIRSERVMIQR